MPILHNDSTTPSMRRRFQPRLQLIHIDPAPVRPAPASRGHSPGLRAGYSKLPHSEILGEMCQFHFSRPRGCSDRAGRIVLRLPTTFCVVHADGASVPGTFAHASLATSACVPTESFLFVAVTKSRRDIRARVFLRRSRLLSVIQTRKKEKRKGRGAGNSKPFKGCPTRRVLLRQIT